MTERVHNFAIKAFINDTSLVVPEQFDIGGVCVYAGFIILCLIYVLSELVLVKQRKLRRDGEPLLKGAVRWAAAAGDLNILNNLSFAPAFDVESDLDGFTALHAAAVGGKRDAVLWLCQRGANVHALKNDQWGDTALHHAAAQGDLSSAQVLLAYGADPTAKNKFGSTPGDLARKRRRFELADFLAACSKDETKRPRVEELKGWQSLLEMSISSFVEDVEAVKETKSLTPEQDAAWRAAMTRSQDGLGTEGTRKKPFTKSFRVLGVMLQIVMLAYLAWRGIRSLIPEPVGQYVYSIIVYIAELSFLPLSFIFVLSLWNTIERPSRWTGDMLPKDELPHVDVYVVRYSEDVDILEPTVIAALNMNWPGDKLTVHILDDGGSKNVLRMVRRLRYQLDCMKREARLVYVARRRVQGVPHHAKAGNINHAILRSQGHGEFIMILDTDMIAHPDFLQRTIGHFYKRSTNGSWRWVQKKRTAFIQTPQDFWNVPPSDPMVHCARFFYGPMLQGRDGIGAAPCCGTGVVFNRTSLISIGGQAYGSITEDYNTSVTLFASGFSSMFLNERLVYGMAPESLIDVFQQRQRWAMGALQILFKDNPLSKPGLSVPQSLLLFEAGAYHFLAIPALIFCIVPFLFIFADLAPITVFQIWEFSIAFGTYFVLNRLTMWLAARGIKGADIEMWRGWQMWIWMAPNHIISIWKVIKSEIPLFRMIFRSKAIAFKVTKKEGSTKAGQPAPPPPKDIHRLYETFCVTWYFVVYDLLFVGAIIYTVYGGVTYRITTWIIAVNCSALLWTYLNCWCTWPPVSTLLPRVETAQGWRIQWKSLFPGGHIIESPEQNTYGVTSLTVPRTQTLPPPSTASPTSPRFRRFRSARPGEVMVDIIPSKALDTSFAGPSDKSNESKSRSDGQTLSKSKSDALGATPSSTPRSTRANSGGFGRVAAPLRTAATMQASVLLTSTILPERDVYSSTASREPSLLAIAPSGELFPAPAGSLSYDVLPTAFSLGRGVSRGDKHSRPGRGFSMPLKDSHRRDSLQGLSLDQQIQMAAEQAMAGTSSKSPLPSGPRSLALSPALSLPKAPSAKPHWMPTTIEEDASFHGSRISYSGPNGQAMREASTAEAGDVIAAAAAKLMTVAEADESSSVSNSDGLSSSNNASSPSAGSHTGNGWHGNMKPPVEYTESVDNPSLFAGYGAFTATNSETSNSTRAGSKGASVQVSKQASVEDKEAADGTNFFSGHGPSTASSIGAQELAALAAMTGDYKALQNLAPVSNSPFVVADAERQQQTIELERARHASIALSSPDSPSSPSSQMVSPRPKRVSFEGAPPFEHMEVPPVDPKRSGPLSRTHSRNENYLENTIPLGSFQDSFYLNESLTNEQAALEAEFFSSFAALAQNEFDNASSGNSHDLGTPVQTHPSGRAVRPKNHSLETAPSASQVRVRAMSQQLLDLAATLTPIGSAALRTQSILVVPVLPASIFDHSIASKPSFEASPASPNDYTYLMVTGMLIVGLIGCSIAEKYLQ